MTDYLKLNENEPVQINVVFRPFLAYCHFTTELVQYN